MQFCTPHTHRQTDRHTHPSKISNKDGILSIRFSGVESGATSSDDPLRGPVSLDPSMYHPGHLLCVETGGARVWEKQMKEVIPTWPKVIQTWPKELCLKCMQVMLVSKIRVDA